MRYVRGDCVCPGSAEVCDGKDNDCDGQRDEGNVCERQEIIEHAGVLDARSSDFDGDGLADACARTTAGLRCHTSRGTSFSPAVTGTELASPQWDDPSNYATIRTGDINGDGLADVCARNNTRVLCWPSMGTAFGDAIAGPEMTDEGGWTKLPLYATIRLADIDHDGRDDLCYRGTAGFRCRLSSGSGFGDAGPAVAELSNESGGDALSTIGTIRMGDVDGDGRADVCARKPGGMWCWLSDGAGFPVKVPGPSTWSNADGWDAMAKWSTIRLADVDGDGRGDLCAREAAGFACHLSTGTGFGESIVGPMVGALWGQRDNYASLRMANIDGIGGDDVCARTDEAIRCWTFVDGAWSAPIDGPAMRAAEWKTAPYYRSLRLADIDGDGRADLCARRSTGVACWPFDGTGFGAAIEGPAWTAARVWEKPAYYSTIRIAGPTRDVAPLPEEDAGVVDEVDAGELEWPDAGPEPTPRGDATMENGCGCRVASARSGVDEHGRAERVLPVIGALGAASVLASRRRRRRSARARRP